MTDFAIEVENLVKVYTPRGREPVRAVDGLSFTVERGAIFGLLGPNGAGKTTTLKVLNTLLQPTSGRALPRWFRIAAQANPITWQVDVLRHASIGLGSPSRIAIEGAGFALFTVVSFFFAIRALRQQ